MTFCAPLAAPQQVKQVAIWPSSPSPRCAQNREVKTGTGPGTRTFTAALFTQLGRERLCPQMSSVAPRHSGAARHDSAVPPCAVAWLNLGTARWCLLLDQRPLCAYVPASPGTRLEAVRCRGWTALSAEAPTPSLGFLPSCWGQPEPPGLEIEGERLYHHWALVVSV